MRLGIAGIVALGAAYSFGLDIAFASPAVPPTRTFEAQASPHPSTRPTPSSPGPASAETDDGVNAPSLTDEDAKAAAQKKPAKDADPKYLVPDSPAFAILGVSSENAIHAQSPRQFAIGLLNGLDKDGNLQNGLAIDYAPFHNLLSGAISRQEYNESYSARFLSRLSFSVATSHGADDADKSLRAAAGLRVTIFDYADTRSSKETDAAFLQVVHRINAAYTSRYYVLSAGGLIEALERQIDCLDIFLHPKDERLPVSCQKLLDSRNAKFAALRRAELKSWIDADIAGQEGRRKELAAELASCDGAKAVTLDQDRNRLEQVLKCKQTQSGLLIAEREKANNKAITAATGDIAWNEAVNRARAKIWNKSNWSIGIAPVWVSKDGNSGKLHPAGLGVYSALSYGFEDLGEDYLARNVQIVLSGLHRTKDLVEDPSDKTKKIEQDSTKAALQFRVRGPDFGNTDPKDPSLVFNIEADYDHADRKALADTDYWTFSAGADIRIDKELVLKVSVGGETKRKDNGESSFVLGRLKWGI